MSVCQSEDLLTETADRFRPGSIMPASRPAPQAGREGEARLEVDPDRVLASALDELERSRPDAADGLLTGALLHRPDEPRLWLAAGIARMRKGALSKARSAFEMCAWISDDSSARELLEVCPDGATSSRS
ncbi:MAG: hypothetical protein R6V85_01160 [Polyangia bacterium]